MTCLYFLGTSGSTQLRGGIVPEAGTVEYCVSGTWKAVCDYRWDYRDAFVVCRQLGFPATGRDYISCDYIMYRYNLSSDFSEPQNLPFL